jgi:hypothetical protein
MSTSVLQSSITADEVIAPGTVIELAFAAPVDPQSAQAAIRVVRGCEPLRVAIELAKRGRVVSVRIDEAVVGACQLLVGEVLGVKGERLVERHRVAFSVLPISGKLPENLRVEHAVRLFIDELQVVRLAPGEKRSEGHIDVVKAVHRRKGTAVELAFDERGARVDIAKELAALAGRRAARFGACTRPCSSGSRKRRKATASTSSSGRGSSSPPPLTKSPPTGARSSRPRARRKSRQRCASHRPRCAPRCRA